MYRLTRRFSNMLGFDVQMEKSKTHNPSNLRLQYLDKAALNFLSAETLLFLTIKSICSIIYISSLLFKV